MPTKPVLVHLDVDDWAAFKELVGNYKASKRLRELMRRDVERLTLEEVRAQQLAGLTEA